MYLKPALFLTMLALLPLGSMPSPNAAAQACDLSHIEFITEHSPPFSYLADGKLVGKSVEAVLALTRAAGCPIKREQISLQPWARGYRSAQNLDNKAIFSITKTKARTPLFQWVGPINHGSYGLLAKKGRQFDFSTTESRSQYRYGAIRDDIGETYLRQFGISDDRIERAVLSTNMAKVLQANRIDLWAYSQSSANDSLNTIGADPNDYTQVHILAKHEYYLAFSLNVDRQIISTLQKAQDQRHAAAVEARNKVEVE